MPPPVSRLVEDLDRDGWRKTKSFSDEMTRYNDLLLDSTRPEEELTNALRMWITEHQPCLFGKIAARHDLISFCILTDHDLHQSDRFIREKLQAYRLQWQRDAFIGMKSAFMVLAASPRITAAEPNDRLLRLGQRLARLYLLEDIEPDRVHRDSITLGTLDDPRQPVRQWGVGVDFFAAAGDKRWWHDHRIPGGIAFSMNSPGHLVASAFEHNKTPREGEGAKEKDRPMQHLGWVLKYAMMTIAGAQMGASGRATELVPLEPNGKGEIQSKCPVRFDDPDLAEMDYRRYLGWYHTDVTLNSVLFRPDVERPDDVEKVDLDFTYIFDADDVDNVDHVRLGTGRRVL